MNITENSSSSFTTMASSNKKRARGVFTKTSGANEGEECIEDVDESSRKRQNILGQKGHQISALPKEIKNQIVNFLDDKSKRMMRATSTEWFKIINYDDFTIYFARPSTLPSLIQTFQRYSKPIGLKLEKTISIGIQVNKAISFNNAFTMLASLTNLTRLEFDFHAYLCNLADLFHFTVLTALKTLSFGSISYAPLVFNHFPNLTHIELDCIVDVIKHNQFEADPSINLIQKLHNVTRLRSLRVCETKVSGLLHFDAESVSKMSNLSKVSISCYDSMFPFSALPNLEYLEIEGDKFDDFSSFSTKLTYLKIEEGESRSLNGPDPDVPHDFQQLSLLTNLRHLELQMSIPSTEYDFLTALTNLEWLGLADEKEGFEGECLQFVRSSKLTFLQCPDGQNDFENISHLTSLQILEFPSRGTPVMFNNVTHLYAQKFSQIKFCPNVRHLLVSEAADSTSAHQAIVSLSQIESLFLNDVDATAVQHMAGLTKLTLLQISNKTQSVDVNYESSLKNLTALKQFEFTARASLKFRGIMPALQSLTNLEILFLMYVTIDDDAIHILESLPNLKHLYVSHMNLREFDASRLSNLTNLQHLYLSVQPSIGTTKPVPIQGKLSNLPYLYN